MEVLTKKGIIQQMSIFNDMHKRNVTIIIGKEKLFKTY